MVIKYKAGFQGAEALGFLELEFRKSYQTDLMEVNVLISSC